MGTTLLFPKNTRYVETIGKTEKFLIEVPPGIFNFKWHDDFGRKPLVEGPVATPWQYFWIPVNERGSNYYNLAGPFLSEEPQLFWAQERLTSLNDPAYVALVPNLSRNSGSVCVGSIYTALKVCKTSVQLAEEFVSIYYESPFNPHRNTVFPYPTFQKWISESKKNKFCWMDWTPITTSLKVLMERTH